MSQQTRFEGNMEYYAGAAKETVGSILGNKQMEVEGNISKNEGAAKVEAVKAHERSKGTMEEIKGNIKEGAGKVWHQIN